MPENTMIFSHPQNRKMNHKRPKITTDSLDDDPYNIPKGAYLKAFEPSIEE